MRLDPVAGRAGKLEGQQCALFGAEVWVESVVDEFRAWAAQRERKCMLHFALEEFRAASSCHPPTHKAWGSLPRVLVAAGLIRGATTDAGDPVYRRAWAPKTHSHPVRVWEIT